MLLRRFAIQNVRSFLQRQELLLDGRVSIVIGPNGGGKTNLLDAVNGFVRKHMYSSKRLVHEPREGQFERHVFQSNEYLDRLTFEKHDKGASQPQFIEVEIEVTDVDLNNMRQMKKDAPDLIARSTQRFDGHQLNQILEWSLSGIKPGSRFTYRWEGGGVSNNVGGETEFLQYLRIFEADAAIRASFEMRPLSTPMLYLGPNRTGSGFPSSVQLSGFDVNEQKRTVDAAHSRTQTPLVHLAAGRMSQRLRRLVEREGAGAKKRLSDDPTVAAMTKLLGELGYEWDLVCIDIMNNTYQLRLKKQGSAFSADRASSGEQELLTYVFAIFILNVRNALIVVDEPELHLHPQWQLTLLRLFERLADATGNQFLLATHSPTFVSPASIQYVSRVFSENQESRIVRLDSASLPDKRHLFNIVNTQNNERLFFADKVVLVEGISDRIFFEAAVRKFESKEPSRPIIEFVSVGGKGFFESYKKILAACRIKHWVLADRDYVEQLATTAELKKLFVLDSAEIKKDVIDNEGSRDGAALVAAIDQAMETRDWADAIRVWEYIKSRRVALRASLTSDEQELFDAFLSAQKKEGVLVLKQGALEAYLPAGYRGKDLDKVIRLVEQPNFWELLSKDSQDEIATIAKAIVA